MGLAGIPVARADTYRADTRLTAENIGAKQTALGDLVADAIRAAVHADIAFIAASSFSDPPVSIGAGAFTDAEVLKTLEYRNDTVVTVKLTGEQVRAALEHSLYLYPKTNSSFLQLSGLVIVVNPEADGEHRLVSARVNDEPLSAGKVYRVAMPSPLANGALAYFKYWKKSDIEKESGKTLENALLSYLSTHRVVGKGDDRLVVKGKGS